MIAPRGIVAAHAALKAWLLNDAYPLWADVGRSADGGWVDAVTLAGRPIAWPARCRVQARQTFAYAVAPRFGWTGDWRGCMRHGLAFLQQRQRAPNGLYRSQVQEDPKRQHDDFLLYDQAFVLFALSHAHAAGEAGAEPAAEDLLARLRAHPAGGFCELGVDDLDANSNMHLFEASLSWSLASGGSVWSALADRQAELCLNVLTDPQSGAVVETFGPGWAMKPPADRTIDAGHQFEWAWLLMRWSLVAGRGQDLRASWIGGSLKIFKVATPSSTVSFAEYWGEYGYLGHGASASVVYASVGTIGYHNGTGGEFLVTRMSSSSPGRGGNTTIGRGTISESTNKES